MSVYCLSSSHDSIPRCVFAAIRLLTFSKVVTSSRDRCRHLSPPTAVTRRYSSDILMTQDNLSNYFQRWASRCRVIWALFLSQNRTRFFLAVLNRFANNLLNDPGIVLKIKISRSCAFNFLCNTIGIISPLEHRVIQFKFSVTWSSTDWKCMWFVKFESQKYYNISRVKTYFIFSQRSYMCQ